MNELAIHHRTVEFPHALWSTQDPGQFQPEQVRIALRLPLACHPSSESDHKGQPRKALESGEPGQRRSSARRRTATIQYRPRPGHLPEVPPLPSLLPAWAFARMYKLRLQRRRRRPHDGFPSPQSIRIATPVAPGRSHFTRWHRISTPRRLMRQAGHSALSLPTQPTASWFRQRPSSCPAVAIGRAARQTACRPESIAADGASLRPSGPAEPGVRSTILCPCPKRQGR